MTRIDSRKRRRDSCRLTVARISATLLSPIWRGRSFYDCREDIRRFGSTSGASEVRSHQLLIEIRCFTIYVSGGQKEGIIDSLLRYMRL
jgi:hypothetical protein